MGGRKSRPKEVVPEIAAAPSSLSGEIRNESRYLFEVPFLEESGQENPLGADLFPFSLEAPNGYQAELLRDLNEGFDDYLKGEGDRVVKYVPRYLGGYAPSLGVVTGGSFGHGRSVPCLHLFDMYPKKPESLREWNTPVVPGEKVKKPETKNHAIGLDFGRGCTAVLQLFDPVLRVAAAQPFGDDTVVVAAGRGVFLVRLRQVLGSAGWDAVAAVEKKESLEIKECSDDSGVERIPWSLSCEIDRFLYCPGSSLLYGAAESGSITSWRCPAGTGKKAAEQVVVLDAHSGHRCRDLARIVPLPQYIFSGGWDTLVQMWDVNKSKLVASGKGHRGGYVNAICSQDPFVMRLCAGGAVVEPNSIDAHPIVFSGGNDECVVAWDVRGESGPDALAEVQRYRGNMSLGVYSVAYRHRQHQVMIGSGEGDLTVFDFRKIARNPLYHISSKLLCAGAIEQIVDAVSPNAFLTVGTKRTAMISGTGKIVWVTSLVDGGRGMCATVLRSVLGDGVSRKQALEDEEERIGFIVERILPQVGAELRCLSGGEEGSEDGQAARRLHGPRFALSMGE